MKISHIEWKHKKNTLRGTMHHNNVDGNDWVIFAHGFSGHRMGPHYLYVKISRALEKRGVSSLRFDFSGSGESDGRFSEMTVATMRDDLLSAVNLVKQKFSPGRLIILGHSLGGTVAVFCAGNKIDGLILLSPVADLSAIAENKADIVEKGTNHDGFYENGPHEMSMKFLSDMEGLDPVKTLAESFRGKLILFQGDSDPSVNTEESLSYIRSADKAGIDNKYFIFRNIDHNYQNVSSIKNMITCICEWFNWIEE